MITVRKAKIKDAKEIQRLIEMFAKKEKMLSRPIYEIYENIRDYCVAESGGKVVGCCALHVFGKEYNPAMPGKGEEILAEIRGLAVVKKWQGKKIGTKLIGRCLKDAKDLGITKAFALILKENLEFFMKFKFKKASRTALPQKIWQECVRCPRFPLDCNEITLILKI